MVVLTSRDLGNSHGAVRADLAKKSNLLTGNTLCPSSAAFMFGVGQERA